MPWIRCGTPLSDCRAYRCRCNREPMTRDMGTVCRVFDSLPSGCPPKAKISQKTCGQRDAGASCFVEKTYQIQAEYCVFAGFAAGRAYCRKGLYFPLLPGRAYPFSLVYNFRLGKISCLHCFHHFNTHMGFKNEISAIVSDVIFDGLLRLYGVDHADPRRR